MDDSRRSEPASLAPVLAALVVLAPLFAGVGALPAGAAPESVGGSGAVTAASPDPAATTVGDRHTAVQRAGDRQSGGDAPALAQEVDADRTRIHVRLEPDGDAVWTLELWTRLEDDAAREAFASLEADVANDSDAFVADFEDRMAGTIAAASDETGRDMALRNVTVSTHTEAIPQQYGVLTYEFRWTDFAAAEGDELRAGDAIDAFLLESGTRLTVAWPEGYRLSSVEPEPDDRSDRAVVWRGDSSDFVTGEPRVVVTSADRGGLLVPAVGAGIVALLALGVGWWLVRTGRVSAFGTGADGPAPAGSGSAAAGGAGASRGSTGGAGGGAGDAGDAPTEGGAPTDDTPEELLSNEERVLRLLSANGGRMKQQQVVAALDWTEAKTSQVVTSMDEAGTIEKFRIGRENVLALPEEADL